MTHATYPYWPPEPPWPPEPWKPEPPPQSAPAIAVAEWERGPLAERLFDQRIVMLHGYLDLEGATAVNAQLLTLAALGDDHIRLHLDSPDGDLHPALSLIDTLDLLTVPVHAVGAGRVGGPVVGILAVASRRMVAPHASLRLSEPRLQVDGSAEEIDARTSELHRVLDAYYERMSTATGRRAADLRNDAQRGRYLTAAEAVEYGLADEVTSLAGE